MPEYLPVGLELDGGKLRVSIWDGQKPGHFPGISEFPALVGVCAGQIVWGFEAQKRQLDSPETVLTLRECLFGKGLTTADTVYTCRTLLSSYWAALRTTLEAQLELPCTLKCIAVAWQISCRERALLTETAGVACHGGQVRVMDSAACILYHYQHHANYRLRGATVLCHLGEDGAELTLAELDGDTLEILNSIWMPDCSAQAIQNELAKLCLILTRQPPEQLPHLLRQLRYQFDALAAVDRVPLYTTGGETEISRKDVLSALESRVSQLSAALDRLREETGFPPDRHGVMISGALAKLPGVEDTLSPVFGGRPIVLEGDFRAADGACLIAAKICISSSCAGLLLNCAGTDCFLMEVNTGRILATVHHWDTIPCRVQMLEPTKPGAIYQIVSASGAHDLELVPATALLAKTADPLCIRLNADHNIELELFE